MRLAILFQQWLVYQVALLLCLLPTSLYAAIYDPILDHIKPDSITLIGESHQKVESIRLFQNLALDALKTFPCIIVGLEIASDQQPVLDDVMLGTQTVNDIEFWPPIDHFAFRSMIEYFAALKRQGQCITVVAIDAGMDTVVDRDQWMALKLSEHVGKIPVLVLVGALHTLKAVNWTVAIGKPFLAENLVKRGFKVASYPQHWMQEQCIGGGLVKGAFVGNESPRALSFLNESLMSLLNAKPHRSVMGWMALLFGSVD